MKIAFFHELPKGGARRAVIEFGKEIGKNHKIDLYYLDEEEDEKEEKIFFRKTFVRFMPMEWKGHNWRSKLYKDTIELYKLYKIHKKLAREIDKKNYDFVFVHGSRFTQAPFILRFLRTKSIYYCQEPLRMVYEDYFNILESFSFGKKFYERINRNNRRILDKSNAKAADLLLANSKFSQKNIKKFLNLDSTVAYLGFDPKIFFPEKRNKKYDVLYIGSKSELDGYYLLKESLPLVKKNLRIKWHISEANWLEDDSAVRRLYSDSKILVCLARKEPFGLLPVEAQACGAVVIAVNDGGYVESVDNLSGRVIKRNKTDLSLTISELISDPKLLRSLSQKAIEKMNSNWTWAKRTGQLISIINEF